MDRAQSHLVEDKRIDERVVRRLGVEEVDGRCYLPYYDARGRVVWHRLRALPDPTGGYTRPKFLNPRGERVRLYNASETQRDVVWITEGETDAMTMLSYTLQTGSPWGVVGVPGASAFREHWKWLFVNASVRIVFDGDEAGRLEARKLGRLLREVVSDVHVVDVPDGMDLNDLWTADRLHEVT